MLAVRLHGAGNVRLEEVEAPGAPGPHEVLVAPLWCGLCGTDAREYFGPGGSVPDEPHPLTGMQKPLILGHEFSARVTAVGESVTRVRVGESVAVYPLVTCGTCEACVGGRPILCVTKAWVGLSTQWGGLGDLALLDESMVSPLGSIDPVLGAMVEPAAVAFQAAVNAGIKPGDTVLVSGCGPIGILAVLAARALGASSVYANDPQPQRAAAAEAAGAIIVPADPEGAESAIHAAVPGSVDAAINCAGKEASLDSCVRSVRAGGIISVPAVHPEPPKVNVWALTRRLLTLTGSLGYTRENWERTIELIASGRFELGKLAPTLIERDRIVEDGFESLGRQGDTKVLVRVGDDRG